MTKLSSIEELKDLFEMVRDDVDYSRLQIVICAGTACQASGANDIIRVAKKYILQNQLLDSIALKITGCHGFCEMGPFILTKPQGAFYHKVSIDNISRIIDAVIADDYVEDLLYRDPKTNVKYYKQDDIPFFKKQQRTIFSKNQEIDPIRIYDYIANNGYDGLYKVFSDLSPEQVLEEVKVSGLRGRGGAGFYTGLKWEMLAKQSSDNGKYIVCNADEGDPGAYMDRSLLEGNPHIIIEGMIIGAFATGANEGVVYVRNEYPLAIKHLIIALRQARDMGLLGDNILGSDFSFDIRIVKGAGAFVCGEETALIKSIEGKVGEPHQRPPYPVQKGIEGKPTVINNVESLANIPFIITMGASEYKKIGTEGNSGTKIFSLVGKIKNTGLIEVPMGITIKEVVYDIGGGPAGNAKIKAVQTGGPSGGCIPVNKFDIKIDYDSLAKAGSIMGSGGMIVMDENTCMIDIAKYFMNFLKAESCGKCYTCRKGTQRMYEILDDISKGKGTLEHLNLLEELALVVKDSTMCGLGQTASNPVLSTLHYFREEYERHIIQKRCDAYVCKELVGAPCQSACPVGTEAWRYVAHIARNEYELAYNAIREANPFPSVCARVCDHKCEEHCRAGTSGGEAIAIRSLKRFITDRIDPSSYKPLRTRGIKKTPVAVIGAGPAGLTTAHYLSLKGYKVAIFEAEEKPGGMLFCAIPSYRLPRTTINKEIASLLDENITLKCNTALGRDITIDKLFQEGYKAVLIAMGAHKSKPLELENENAKGVYPAIEFLKAFNLRDEQLAKGRVGVIGGGNSAIDAARTALRQKNVESVTILYRRTREEMPAFTEEIEAADQEGIKIKTLVTPTKIMIINGVFSGLECIKNELGDIDASGRRRPVPLMGSEHIVELDTLIVAISEDSGIDSIGPAQASKIEVTKWNTITTDKNTLLTSRPGVFAAGDAVTGPNTVIDAIAAGKKAAQMIDRYLSGEELDQPAEQKLPQVFIEPVEVDLEDVLLSRRSETPRLAIEKCKNNFTEVEVALSEEDALHEAIRCLRCDLEFTQPKEIEEEFIVKERELT
ncbi:MAG: FAD-dependent oxidoreductase [Bacteroidetes bacterium]|nr:FAD-dependent oxidoreductase [Bacteroidota bacterium]MBL7104779.1 FAD-dependent oxidoreductase [Bacteroidales bacterium]